MNSAHVTRSAGDVAAEIVMQRLNWKGAFLMVEGPTDSRFWRSRKSDLCDLVVAHGRAQVLGAAEIIAKSGLDGVLGVVDDDSDKLTCKPHGVANVISTEPRDLEGILLRSGALERALAEYGDSTKISAFLAVEPPSIRDALLRRAELFGKIRFVNRLRNKPVSLDALRPTRFRVKDTWTYDDIAVLAEAVRLGVSVDTATLIAEIDALPAAQPWHLCRGHDLLLILADGLKTVLGIREVGEAPLCMCLRLAYQDAEFRTSKLYAEVSDWETENAPYEVLRR
jgi:hypothetical protein